MSGSDNTHAAGMIMMAVGVCSLAINDAMAKMLTDTYSPMQILFLRNLIALPVALVLCLWFSGPAGLRSQTPRVHLVRGLFWVLATFLFFTSIAELGLAKSTALIFLAPLLIVAIAAVFLGEVVDFRRWSLVILGFIGAMIILRPGAGTFDPVVILPLLAALMAAFLMLSARLVDPAESFWTLLVYLTGASAVISGAVVWIFWVPVQSDHLLLFVGVGLFGTLGMVLMTQAFRLAPAVVVAPIDYTALIWATLLGWWFWNEVPDALTYVGAGVIVASGIGNLWLDRGGRRSAPPS